MNQTVLVNCPQGIDSLIAFGRGVAARHDWADPRAPEAFVGLWLGNVLMQAELRGATEVQGTRVQANVQGAVTAANAGNSRASQSWLTLTDRQLVDRVLGQFTEYVARVDDGLARAAGATTPESVSLTVAAPANAGVVGAGVILAAVAIAVGIPTIGYVSSRVIDWWREKSRSNTAVDVMATCSERAQTIADKAQAEQRSLTEAERIELQTCEHLGAQAIKGLTTPNKSAPLLGIDTDPVVLLALALGALWLFTRRK